MRGIDVSTPFSRDELEAIEFLIHQRTRQAMENARSESAFIRFLRDAGLRVVAEVIREKAPQAFRWLYEKVLKPYLGF